ncbi:MAG: PAS domain-containing protein [Gemmatimonadota bacterium]|nr:MAG: PAS domain-containing protein [Gemmatimonadota bacterium]
MSVPASSSLVPVRGGLGVGGRVKALQVLRWIYLARLSLAGGIFAAAVLAWSAASPNQTLSATLALVATLTLTSLSYWHSHVRMRQPGTVFLHAQAVLDIILVTLVVHLTGGRESIVAPLYILVISAYTLILPFSGSLLVSALACLAYLAESTWVQGGGLDTVVALQVGIFATLAVVVGLVSSKLRQTGAELTSVESALEQLRTETGDILANIPTALLTVDADGRLVYANPAAQRLLAIDLGLWLDRPVLEELGRRSAGLEQALERTRRHRLPVASAEIAVRRGDQEIPVGISTALLDRIDGPPSVTAIMRDISDRKQMEELRRRTQRLEAVAELSASLAHEIKNPLASISSSVQQLGLREGADEDDRILSQLILRESDRLARLLSDFIDFARIRIERSEELDLREVAKHAVKLVRQHPSYRAEIEIRTQLDADPVVIEGDEDLMHRVVVNLVLNAVQAAQPGRQTNVLVEVRGGAGDCAPRGIEMTNPVVMIVADDGPGIERADLQRIFDPFFSRRRGGSGLGLAIVHRAIREHQGTVLVTSTPGKGTCFTVCLPGRVVDETSIVGEFEA